MNKKNNLIEAKKKTAPAPQLKQSRESILSDTSTDIYTVIDTHNKLSCIDGGVGSGKTTLMLKNTIKTMFEGGIVVYGVHSIDAQVERSQELEAEILNCIRAGYKKLQAKHSDSVKSKIGKLEEMLVRIKQVSSKDLDRGLTVDSMFQNIMNEMRQNESSIGATIFVTNVAIRLIDFTELSSEKDVLVMDDDTTGFVFSTLLEQHSAQEVEILKACFNHEVVSNDKDETIIKLKNKASQFDQRIRMIGIENKTSTQFTSIIKKLLNKIVKETNNDSFLRIYKKKNGLISVDLFSKLSKNILDQFKKIYAISENVKNDNTAVFSWIKDGVTYDYSMLTYDNGLYGNKFLYGEDGKPMIKVASIAGKNRFTISKATSNSGKSGYGKISEWINNLGEEYTDVLASVNSRVAKNAFNGINRPVITTSTVTRGRNDLMHCNVSLFYGLNKIDIYTASILNKLYGVNQNELNEQITISANVQNTGRTALRTKQTKPIILIFQDNELARLTLIRFAKSYPELLPFVDGILSDIEVINEEGYQDESKKYENDKEKNRVNYLKKVHGDEQVQSFIDLHGINTAVDYFSKVSCRNKVLLKQITKVAQRVKRYIKADELKCAAKKVGIELFLKRVEHLKGKQIVELVNDIEKDGKPCVDEKVILTASQSDELTNFEDKMQKCKNHKIEFIKNKSHELDLISVNHEESKPELAIVNFLDSCDISSNAFNYKQLKSTAFKMDSMY